MSGITGRILKQGAGILPKTSTKTLRSRELKTGIKPLPPKTGQIKTPSLLTATKLQSLYWNTTGINGQRWSSTAKPYQTQNPATGKIEHNYPFSSKKDVIEALHRAKNAQKNLAKTDWKTRSQYLLNIANALEKNNKKLADLITTEMGKPISQSTLEVQKAISAFRTFSAVGASMIRPKTMDTDTSRVKTIHEPVGVELNILSGNNPTISVVVALAQAIVRGNTTLYKPPENTPQMALTIQKILQEAQIPEGIFEPVLLTRKQAQNLIKSPEIGAIGFIGGTKAYKEVSALATKHNKPFYADAGGNAAMIVKEDANMTEVGNAIIAGRLGNAGQSCVAPKRIICVGPTTKENLLKELMPKIKTYKVGNPRNPKTQMGPLGTAEAKAAVNSLVEQAIEGGARIIFRGEVPNEGAYSPITVLDNLTKESIIMKEEIFGPVIPFFEVKSDEEAIDLANASPFGLSATIWGKNDKELHNIAQQLDVGNVGIRQLIATNPLVPFGARKESGSGFYFGQKGIDQLLSHKVILSPQDDNSFVKADIERTHHLLVERGKINPLNDVDLEAILDTATYKVQTDINTLFSIGKVEGEQGTTALAFSAPYIKKENYVIDVMKSIGMTIERDGVGNLSGILPGTKNSNKRVMLTSHIDSVINAGPEDGIRGVMSALRSIEAAKDAGITFENDIEVRVCMAEESPAVNKATFGSLVSTGQISYEDLHRMTMPNDTTVTVYDAINSYRKQVGEAPLTKDIFNASKLKKETYLGGIEFHIQQFQSLQTESDRIGTPQLAVLRAIGGHARYQVTFRTTASQKTIPNYPHKEILTVSISSDSPFNHSGATPMGVPERTDTSLAAARLLRIIERSELSNQNHVIAVDIQNRSPQSSTTIPGKTECKLLLQSPSIKGLKDTKKAVRSIISRMEEKCNGTAISTKEELDTTRPANLISRASVVSKVSHFIASTQTQARKKASLESGASTGTVTTLTWKTEDDPAPFLVTSLDIRSGYQQSMDDITNNIDQIMTFRKANGEWLETSKKAPVPLDEELRQRIRNLYQQITDEAPHDSISVPGQDSGVFQEAGIPFSTIFTPNHGGGHNPNERTTEDTARRILTTGLASAVELDTPTPPAIDFGVKRDKLIFPMSEYSRRLEAVQANLKERGLKAMLLTDPSAIHWLSGFTTWGRYTFTGLIVQDDHLPIILTRNLELSNAEYRSIIAPENAYGFADGTNPADSLANLIKAYDIPMDRFGVEKTRFNLSPQMLEDLQTRFPATHFEDVYGITETPRSCLSPLELLCMKRAGKIMNTSMKEITEQLPTCRSEADLAALTSHTLFKNGSHPASLPIFVAIGAPYSGLGHSTTQSTEQLGRRIRHRKFMLGESGLLELATAYHNYIIALMRNVINGVPTPETRHMEQVLQRALIKVRRNLKPGMTGEEIDRIMSKAIQEESQGLFSKGSRTGYLLGAQGPIDWGLGHIMQLVEGEQRKLKENMVFHVLAYVQAKDGTGGGITDTLVVTPNGGVSLTNLPYEFLYTGRN